MFHLLSLIYRDCDVPFTRPGLPETCGEYPFFRIIDITQEKGLCSESVTECEMQVCR